jgi:hypothetical protein
MDAAAREQRSRRVIRHGLVHHAATVMQDLVDA